MRIVLVHVLARATSQLLTDLERNVGVGHHRVNFLTRRQSRRLKALCREVLTQIPN
jgi:hypothetical protein